MSLDERIGKIEVDPKEEASVVEVFQDVLDKLYDVGKKDQLLKFFKLVQDGKFPLNNKLGVLIDGDFKFGLLLLVFVRFFGGDTGNLYRNGFL
jgi:hypothetical protein